jgi:hypothetical protein
MFRGSIDRELGLAEAADARARRRSWLRDWPLVLGLAVSAALIAGSILIGGSQAKPAAKQPKEAAPGLTVSGEVVDVGEPAPAVDPEAPAAPAEKPKTKPGKAASRGKGTASADSSNAADAPAPTSTSGGGSSSSTPKRTTRSPGRSGGGGSPAPAKPGRIVNVTGTSAAFTSGPLAYTFGAPTHTPAVGKRWRLQVGVKRSGRPVSGTVKIDILHQGQVVGHVTDGPLKGGRFAHDFDWPKESVGHPLTVKTTVYGGGFQQSFLFAVKVGSAG